jgi:hypothetical protein
MSFDEPVYFVAFHLHRRWPELSTSTAWMPFEEIPASRWAPLENIWIVSSYLRLRAADQNVQIVDRPVPGAINICCDSDLAAAGIEGRCFVVATQGDRGPLVWANHLLVQSPEQLKGPHTTLIRHWPQPGLIGRDPGRGSHIGRLGYVGPVENLARVFRTNEFRDQLKQLGVELVIRDDPRHWHDFSDLDLYLAVRDWPWHLIRTKPATKLAHAWLTGVPGLLGSEPAYRYYGQDGIDYFEVTTPEDVVAVVRRLKEEPGLYDSVRQHGFVKAAEHSEEAVIRQWIAVLKGPVYEHFKRWKEAGTLTWKLRSARRKWHKIRSPLQKKMFTLRSRGWRAVSRRFNQKMNG